jgi:simple sugar transport system permease protein
MMNTQTKNINYNSILTGVIAFIIAILIAFALTSGLIFLTGFRPLQVFWLSISGGFGSVQRILLTLNEATPLLFCTLGLIVAFKAAVWNIGAEGQLYIGALGTTIAGLSLNGIPTILKVILIFLFSFIFGAVWGAIPGFLKARFKTNEIIVSLLLNFVAIWFVGYLIRFPMLNPKAYIPVSYKLPENVRLPLFVKGNPGHIGIIVALLCAVLVWFIFDKTVMGYRFKSIGVNINTALYGGIMVNRFIVIVMIISGGLAGLAGWSQVAGVYYELSQYLSPAQYGFLAIPIAFIARLNPFGAVITCLFFGGLLTGSKFVELTLGIDPTVISVFVSLIMLTLMLGPFLEKLLTKIMYKK